VNSRLNQYERIETTGTGVNSAQAYQFDADGNMEDACVAADMDCSGVIDPLASSPSAAPKVKSEYVPYKARASPPFDTLTPQHSVSPADNQG